MKYLTALLPVLVIAGAVNTVYAGEDAPRAERTSLQPTMAKFYRVDESGQAEDAYMSVEAIGRKVDREPQKARPPAAKRKPVARSASSSEYQITITRTPKPKRDIRAEWQCERNGFYYTQDGRCVAPASSGVRRVRR